MAVSLLLVHRFRPVRLFKPMLAMLLHSENRLVQSLCRTHARIDIPLSRL